MWGEPSYARDDTCEQLHVCSRCGEKKALPVRHAWGESRRRSEEPCFDARVCQRCQFTEPSDEHIWDVLDVSRTSQPTDTMGTFYTKHTEVKCFRCGAHTWTAETSAPG